MNHDTRILDAVSYGKRMNRSIPTQIGHNSLPLYSGTISTAKIMENIFLKLTKSPV